MKEKGIKSWQSPNDGATNESGFSALPAGSRGFDGSYGYMSIVGFFWSSMEYDSSNVWCRYLSCDNLKIYHNFSHKVTGFSVRCIQDQIDSECIARSPSDREVSP